MKKHPNFPIPRGPIPTFTDTVELGSTFPFGSLLVEINTIHSDG